LPTAAAFLMRTSMSAMGSVMLMWIHLMSSTDIRFRENLFWMLDAGRGLAAPGARIAAGSGFFLPTGG
jgi:hypothetical protein